MLPLLAAAGLAIATPSTPPSPKTPPIWGGGLQWSSDVTITRTDNTRGHPRWNASYIYDAVDGAERFHMNEGQGDQSCAVTLIGNGKPCIVLNADDGESYIIDPDRGGGCCRYPTHLPRFRSNFLELEGATFNGYANVTGQYVALWMTHPPKRAGEFTHPKHYADTADTNESRPVLFWQRSAPDESVPWLRRWDFLPGTFQPGPPKESGALTPPEACRASPPICKVLPNP